MQSVEIREKLVEALRLDLVGPEKGSPLEDEILSQAPSRWYLTGFLVPLEAGQEQRMDEDSGDKLDEIADQKAADDADIPEPPSAKRAFFPSSMGLSLLTSSQTRELIVTVRWGDYKPLAEQKTEPETPPEKTPENPTDPDERPRRWQRVQKESIIKITLPKTTPRPKEYDVLESDGLKLVLTVQPIADVRSPFPQNTRSLSLFLVNRRPPAPNELRDVAFIFQAQLIVKADAALIPRANHRGLLSTDWDERVADLQYRNAVEYAVGHGISTTARIVDSACYEVETQWIPQADVERVAPAPIKNVELSMEALSQLKNGDEARTKLGNIVVQYANWIETQKTSVPTSPPQRKETGEELLRRAHKAANRIKTGIDLLNDPQNLDAFCMANRVMAIAARRRFGVIQGKDPASVDAPTWRPFQLAFILLNLPGIANPIHPDRETVDLLFFPTGGGKTEAYLGLATFTLILRRLRNPGLKSAGLSVLMRYTLRLLTLDQLGRASTLICALELERQKDPQKLGEWPFEIGLWVGKAATPNWIGKKGDRYPDSARSKTIAYLNNSSKAMPLPIEECPWCGTKFSQNSFQLLPDRDDPNDLRLLCTNRRCEFIRGNYLPILAVDESIYRRLPCFLIATVDKFAAMPWTGEVGGFFGRIDRHDANGFYGPGQTNGQPLGHELLPPELIIQDELHLISGPMGTMVGLYETALDELSARQIDGQKVRPKIIASTATVRRAEKQIQALFNRRIVEIFPPPGPDLRDSFFAKTESISQSNARCYVGIAAQGRSLKVVLLRIYLALMGAAQKAYVAEKGNRNKNNPADPYMTLLGYFNSLRELGGSRRIIEDEVRTRLSAYGKRKRENETESLFADRKIDYDVVELTSRVSTDKVAEAKHKLDQPFFEKDRVDIAIATNMISVGLDITRLGLMVVLGQPKTSAEYIQATSRVGRDHERPGLVVTLFNIHRPRDRSHYERFATYHESFYRSVEATSVTPFSPRALDRGLAGTVLGLARLGHKPMTPPLGAMKIRVEKTSLNFVIETLAKRAQTHDPELPAAEADALYLNVKDRVLDLFSNWQNIAEEFYDTGIQLQYQTEVGGAQRLLYEFLNPDLKTLSPARRKFCANRSMRDVEPNVNLWLKTLDNLDIEEDEE
jgi:hypothetical protein